jgi:hypothetical protein
MTPPAKATPLPTLDWVDRGSHRPIAADITLEASDGTRRIDERKKRKKPGQRRFPAPAYSHRSWYTAAKEMEEALARVQQRARSPTDVDGLYSDIFEVVTSALEHVREAGEERWGGRPRPEQGPPPTPELRRLYEQLHIIDRALRKRRNKPHLHESERAELEQQRDNIKRMIYEAKKQQLREHRQKIADMVNSCRPGDPHMMHKIMSKIVGSAQGGRKGTDIECPDDFFEHNRRLFEETRPMPPAMSSPARMAEVPTAIGPVGNLLRPATWQEVYGAMYPMHAESIGVSECCDTRCIYCREVREQAREHLRDPRNIPAPKIKPALNTARASGPDGVPAEGFSFTRPEECSRRMPLRQRVCTLAAAWITACITTGAVPNTHGFSQHTTSLLLKPGTPDFPSDPQDPNDYRAITVGNTLEKLLEAVLYRRLMHWAVINGLIPETQAGFMEHMGAELHVFTLLETIRHEWRNGRKCYAVFVDLRKAYDNVHLEALWMALACMGVPAELLKLLRAWAARRTTSIKVGDLWSEEIRTDKGTPQGSVLSPLLFNLFIASLHRCLNNLKGWAGVTLKHRNGGSVTIKDLFYADDLAALASTILQCQLVLTAIYEWARDWGLELGIGRDKTAAMVFDPQAKEANTSLTPLRAGDSDIPWVPRYKYLGYILRFDLRNDSLINPADGTVTLEGMADRLRGKLDRLSLMFFSRNPTMWYLPLATQFQFVGSIVQAALSYLFSVVPLSKAELENLDRGMNEVVRNVLGLTKSTPRTIIQAESRVPSFRVVQLTHRVRLLQYFKHGPFPDGVAARVYRITVAERVPAKKTSSRTPWAAVTDNLIRECTGAAARFGRSLQLEALNYHDIHRACTVLGRNMGYVWWASEAVDAATRKMPTGTNTTSQAYAPPADGRIRSRFGVIAAADTYRIDAHTMPDLGNLRDSTALAIVGPSCSGSLIAASTVRPKYAGPAIRCRMGTVAITVWPFGALPASCGGRRTARTRAATARYLEDANRRAVEGCANCGANTPEDVWHAVLECSSHRYSTLRQRLLADVPIFLQQIAAETTKAMTKYDESYRARPASGTETARKACRSIPAMCAQALNWETTEGRFLLYRLLTVMPFPATTTPTGEQACRTPEQLLLHTLGTAFSHTQLSPRFLRILSNVWVLWSYKWLSRFGAARCGPEAPDAWLDR